MKYVEESCETFIDLLAGKGPTPGGGGASALTGALGTALGHMVGSLTEGKKKYKEVEGEIRSWMEQAKENQKALLELVQEDARSFEPLAAAYRMPSETEAQREEKARIMEDELCGNFAEKGSKLAISDAGAGASFCRAALESASFNIYINTKSMKDREYARQANRRADEMRSVYMAKADRIIEQVFQEIK